MNIIIDTKGQPDLVSKDRLLSSDDDDVVFEDIGLEPANLLTKKKKPKKRKRQLGVGEKSESRQKKSSIDIDLDDFEREMGWTKKRGKQSKKKQQPELDKKPKSIVKISSTDIDLDEFEREMGWNNKRRKQPKKVTDVAKITKAVDPVEKVMQKTAIKPGFEQSETVPRYDESRRRLRILRQKEREKTKGKKWFNLPATEMTEEIKHDLQIIQMRSVLDPKHFYKKNDIKALPKYFQIGKIMDSPVDYYNGRLTKKERKRTIVDELMADAEFAKYNKRKYKEIIDEKRQLHYKAHKHARKLKGKKK